jgi:hypothetical protein
MLMRMLVCVFMGDIGFTRYCEGRPHVGIHENVPNVCDLATYHYMGGRLSMPNLLQETWHRSYAVHTMCPDVADSLHLMYGNRLIGPALLSQPC